jgi:hypothetical protein
MSALSAFLNWRAGKKASAAAPSLTRKNPPFDPAAKSKLPKEIVNAIGVLSTNQLEQLRKELAIPYPERPYKKDDVKAWASRLPEGQLRALIQQLKTM